MKRLAAILLALAICLTPMSGAYAYNDYDILSDCCILRVGSSGAAVRRLQNALIDLDYLPEGSADGVYGEQTAAAVADFQSRNGFAGEPGFEGVATMFTQAVLFGDEAEPAGSLQARENDGSGKYGLRKLELRRSARLEPSFTFVNYDSKDVSAICIYYWLADGDNNLVPIQGSDYWQQWYYGMELGCKETMEVTITLEPTAGELARAHTLRCSVGEIAYENAAVYITFNASKPAYNTANYILGEW